MQQSGHRSSMAPPVTEPHSASLSAYEYSPAHAVMALIGLVATGAGAYHGYKRNDSVGWAIGWGLLSGMFPYIALPIAAAQGFGERRRDER